MRAILHDPQATLLTLPKDPELLEHASASMPHPASRLLTIACDSAFVLMTIGAGILLHALVVAVWPPTARGQERQLIEWMPFWALTTTALSFLLWDVLRCRRSRRCLPFDFSEQGIRLIYWQRLEIILGAIATHLMLLCLCLLLPAQPLFSKLFLTSIIALVALAVRRSIPTRKLAFAAFMGIFSGAMFIVTVAGMVKGG